MIIEKRTSLTTGLALLGLDRLSSCKLSTLATPSTADSYVPKFPAILFSDSKLRYASTRFGTAGSTHCLELNIKPNSAGTESNPHAEMIKEPVSAAFSPYLASIRSMNSGSPHMSK